jgi:hypothetical protein
MTSRWLLVSSSASGLHCRYNKRYGEDGCNSHAELDWTGQQEAVEKFKDEFIFSDIVRTEVEEKSMMAWLGQVLPMHTFTPRHFESDVGEPQPLAKAGRMVASMQKKAAAEEATADQDSPENVAA